MKHTVCLSGLKRIMVDLEDKYIIFIKDIISKYLADYVLYLYGSRAKGTARKYSDVDLAISSPLLTPEIKSKIEFDLENSTFPYKVDLTDLNNITTQFKKLIESSLVRL